MEKTQHPFEKHAEDRTAWTNHLKTLLDGLDLIDKEHLPGSWDKEILAPVQQGKHYLQSLTDAAASLALLRLLSETAAAAVGKPWYFWEKLGEQLASFAGAESCTAFRMGERNELHKIHPLGPEEDSEDLVLPRAAEDEPFQIQLGDQAQTWVLRTGKTIDHPLVFFLQRKLPAPRINMDRLVCLQELNSLIFSIASQHCPNLVFAKSMEIIGSLEDQSEEAPILGRDPGFLEALASVKQAATTDAPVYLKGESGTGKELFARYLHDNSVLAQGPFIPINCSAIPHELIESELFGHEKGAFTGAYYRKIGKAEQANGGTLFLDEIGEMPLAFQAKMLRFLQEKKFTRVGGNQQVTSDARIVVATHRDLKDMVAKGSFREDLYYRVHVIPIQISPLRERGGDIRYIAEKFFAKYISKSRMSRRRVEEGVFDVLEAYHYPGNVRELDNIIQRTVVMTQKATIGPEDLPEEVFEHATNVQLYQLHPFEKFDNMVPRDRETLRWLKKEAESVAFSYQRDLDRRFLLHLLRENEGSARKAAEAASINRTLFYKLLKRAGLDISILQKSDS